MEVFDWGQLVINYGFFRVQVSVVVFRLVMVDQQNIKHV